MKKTLLTIACVGLLIPLLGGCNADNKVSEMKTGWYAHVTPATNPRATQLPDSWPCEAGTCLDMHSWKPVTSELEDALNEGLDVTREWSDCWSIIGDTSYVVCPDGTIETS